MELRNFVDHHCKWHTLLLLKIGLLWFFFLNIFYLRSMSAKVRCARAGEKYQNL